MNVCARFIARPVATLLLTGALVLAGLAAYRHLSVAALPRMDIPTITVAASLTGASPEIMANTVATPLIKEFSTIPSIREMTAASRHGSTTITLEFTLDRDIDMAAADVQAALSRVGPRLPAEMTSSPVYRKLNLADSPVLLLILKSDVHSLPRLDEMARALVLPRLSAIAGVGQVTVSGGQKYAVRIRLDPHALAGRRIGVDEVERTVRAANTSAPAGSLEGRAQRIAIDAATQLGDAEAFRNLIVTTRAGRPVRLGDIAQVVDSVEDDQRAAWHDGSPALVLAVQRQPEGNTVEVIDAVKASLGIMRDELGAGVTLIAMNDRSLSIRAAIEDVMFTLGLTILLVCAVIYLCLGRLTTTLVAGVMVPVSIVSTFAAMYGLGLSLDNITLLALTLSVGLVVDDAVVVADNTDRHIAAGVPPLRAAVTGANEIIFTVLSITLSLIAAFIPLLMMGGVVGRILQPFAITVSIALLVSAVLSLTLAPMLLSRLPAWRGRGPNLSDRAMAGLTRYYGACLDFCLRFQPLTLVLLLVSVVASGWLFRVIPKGFLPQDDTGQILVSTRARDDVSFAAMSALQGRVEKALRRSPDVAHVVSEIGATGTTSLGEGRLFVELKPRSDRAHLQQVLADLRRELSAVSGIESIVTTEQHTRMGGQPGRSPYQLTVQARTPAELRVWSTRLSGAMSGDRTFVGIQSDLHTTIQATIKVDRDKARQLGIGSDQLRAVLHTGFAARQVATIHRTDDSYQVLIQYDPDISWTLDRLALVAVRSDSGVLVPLSSFATLEHTAAPRLISQLGQLPVARIFFDLPSGISLGQALARIDVIKREEGLPSTVVTGFVGTARVFQDMVKNQSLLLAAAVLTIYIVLGILYESAVHPLTILAGLPSAAFGAVAALHLCGMELNVMGLIGILMLFGIVKKNAIMMIDVAIARRRAGDASHQAIRAACLMRFRPILITSLVALAGAIPIAIGQGAGADLRQPLGVTVAGGLVVSQVLTLFITPVLYLCLERLSEFGRRCFRKRQSQFTAS